MNTERLDMSPETKIGTEPTIIEVAPLGFGEGKISRTKQLETGELSTIGEDKGVFYITQDDSYVYVEVEDDGCGDGRVTISITQVTKDGVHEFKRSAFRAKVFGGGAVMAATSLIGIGQVEKTAKEQFEAGIEMMENVGIKYGAHDDDHAQGEKCGCGAIDNYPAILLATHTFKHEIEETMVRLFGDSFDDAIFNTVIDRYQQAFNNNYDDYSGAAIKAKIQEKGAVVKKLGGNHQEDFLILNFVEGTTFNQHGLFEYTGNAAQAFSVDVWRVEEYAQKIAEQAGANKDEAFYSMLIYTLATSAVLTDGSQRVFVRK